MEALSTLAQWVWQYGVMFLLVLTLVVFIHELGHFLVARWCGVAVKAFSIGFGPEIFGFYDKHGTRWRFAWIPAWRVREIHRRRQRGLDAGQGVDEALDGSRAQRRVPDEVGRSAHGRRRGGPDRQFSACDRALYVFERGLRRAHHAGLR